MLQRSQASAVARAQAHHQSYDNGVNADYWHMRPGYRDAALSMWGSGIDTHHIASELGVHQSVVANAIGRR